ncbi:hypothetical protein OAR29_02315 [Rhodospirillales bacterium]|nr:hypothetical protein [Rhodospirillales bacterium]
MKFDSTFLLYEWIATGSKDSPCVLYLIKPNDSPLNLLTARNFGIIA